MIIVVTMFIFLLKEHNFPKVVILTSWLSLKALRTIPTGVNGDLYFNKIAQACSKGAILLVLLGL
jgi:hypothetical protein